MPQVGFEPTISAGERPKTYALDRAATGNGTTTTTTTYYLLFITTTYYHCDYLLLPLTLLTTCYHYHNHYHHHHHHHHHHNYYNNKHDWVMRNVPGYDAASRGNRFQKLRSTLSFETRLKYPVTRCSVPAQKYSYNTPCKPPKNKYSLSKLPYFNQYFRQLEWNATWKRILWTVWNPNTSLHVRIVVINKNHGIYCQHGFFGLFISSTQNTEYEKAFLWDDCIYDTISIHFSSYCTVHEIGRR